MTTKFTDKFVELHDLFCIAEENIKMFENLNIDGLVIPAINELRYAGKHCLLSIINDSDEDTVLDNIHKAKDHCKRATYDALEMGILTHLEKINIFRQDFRTTVVAGIIPNYANDLKSVEGIKIFISSKNRMNITDVDYQQVQTYYNELKVISDHFEFSREELNKIVAK